MNWKGNRKCDERKKRAITIEGGSEARKTREGKVNRKLQKSRRKGKPHRKTKLNNKKIRRELQPADLGSGDSFFFFLAHFQRKHSYLQ
jgi:hypothetical protein